jgi:hypothetical protein
MNFQLDCFFARLEIVGGEREGEREGEGEGIKG